MAKPVAFHQRVQYSRPMSQNKTAAARQAPLSGPATLFLCPPLTTDIVSAQIIALASAMRRGGQPTILHTAGGTLCRDAERLGLPLIRGALPQPQGWAKWHALKRFRTILQQSPVGAMVAVGGGMLPHLAAVAETEIPVLLYLFDSLPASEQAMRWLQMVMPHTTLVVPTEALRLALTTGFGISAQKITVIRPGIEPAQFDPGMVQTERLMNCINLWRLPEDKTVLMHALPWSDCAGHMLFLEAVAQLPKEGWHAVLNGGDLPPVEVRAKLEAQIMQLSLQHNVVIADSCPDWPAALWLSDAVLSLGTQGQGHNLPLLAAQAMGRVVIAADVGGNAEQLMDEAGAWLMAQPQPSGVARLLLQLLTQTLDMRHGQALNARQGMREHFPLSAWIAAMRAQIGECQRSRLPDRMVA